MPRINREDAIRLYKSGLSCAKVAKELGHDAESIRKCIKKAGVIRNRSEALSKPRIIFSNEQQHEIIQLYKTGIGAVSIGEQFGVDKNVIRRRLDEWGIPVRGVVEANRIMMAARTPEEHSRNVIKAHEAVRGSRRSKKSLRQAAQTNERNGTISSTHEKRFAKFLRKAGIAFTPQKAINTYNVDFSIDGTPIAVEIFGSRIRATLKSFAPKFNKRSKKILKAGYILVIVWATEEFPIKRRCINKLVSLLDVFRESPTELRKQYVMLGNGEPTTLGSDNIKYRTGVFRPKH